MSTVRCVVALSVTNNWPLFQLDVNNAFLYGDLDEDIYMTIPKGFASKDNKNKENGFVQSSNDHSLFTKSKSNKFIALFVYVDDIVITGNCVDEIDKKDLCLSQRKYCLELLKEYGLLGCKPVSTPMEPNSVLPYIPSKDDPLLDNITRYQKLLGKLIYLTHTRPNIAYSVYFVTQYIHSPLKSHLNCSLNVLRYLKGALGKGIRYNYGECKNNLSGYSKADWAKCLKTRKSITGYYVFFNNCLISWKSKKQNTISKSSIEAEYRSLSSAAYDINSSDKSNPKTVVGSSSDLNLSFGDSLYLHLNDTSGTPIITLKSNLLTRESLPSVKIAFPVISGEESHMNVTSVRTTKPATTAFAAKTFDNKKKFNNNYKGSGSNSNFNSNNNNRGPNPNLKCTNCNKTGHTVDRCFDLIGYPASYVKRNSSSNSRLVTNSNASVDVHYNGVSSNNATNWELSPDSLSSDQFSKLMNLLNENGGFQLLIANMAVKFL
ncbi:ribonuclease H-like domain-containing protein [Tanacetum coccineum]